MAPVVVTVDPSELPNEYLLGCIINLVIPRLRAIGLDVAYKSPHALGDFTQKVIVVQPCSTPRIEGFISSDFLDRLKNINKVVIVRLRYIRNPAIMDMNGEMFENAKVVSLFWNGASLLTENGAPCRNNLEAEDVIAKYLN